MIRNLPGIDIRHQVVPKGHHGLVRSDIAGLIGFIPEGRWPTGASVGDTIELVVQTYQQLDKDPRRDLLDPACVRAAASFFDNGGSKVHLFGLCIQSHEDLKGTDDGLSVLAPLLDHLRSVEDISILACPGAAYLRCYREGGRIRSDADALYNVLLRHCREMSHRFMLIDSPRGLHGDALRAWVSSFRDQEPENRSFGALYYPWVVRGKALEPPSGSVLGVFSREASTRGAFGVVWPPANVPVYRLSGMEIDLQRTEARELAAESINPLIMEQGLGTSVSGARTLSKNPQWEFINARRTVSMITEQLRRDNQWVVFEQNDPKIWKSLERDVRVRLDQFWKGGLLTGQRAGADYQVICDTESNSKADRAEGVLNVWVDLRPVGTTEHVRIELRLTDSLS
jgi:hypothetical protein